MKLTLVNFQSEEEISLDAKDPVIIGRGSLFGCSDKKVSRNHGKVQLTPEGNVLLVALHSNPCFFMRNGLPPVLQLTKHQEEVLKNGDYIGLLPDSFWFKIVVENKGLHDSTDYPLDVHPNNVGNESESFKQDVSDKLDVSGVTSTNEEERNLDDPFKESMSVDLTERLKALEKTKKLPISMYEIDDYQGKIEEVSLPGEFSEGNKTHINDSTKHIEKNLSAETSLADSYLNKMDCVLSDHNPEVAEGQQTKLSQNGAQIEESNLENVPNNSKGNATLLKVDDAEYAPKDSNFNSGHKQKRPLCLYEEKCYRKNGEHRGEFCHPGDPDFIPYAKRPKCQYGASCYRRNKTHLVEYQHPEGMKPNKNAPKDSPKRKREKKEKESSYRDSSDGEDDYDLEDPFINDGTSDEYIPSDFDESDDEMDDLTSKSATLAQS